MILRTAVVAAAFLFASAAQAQNDPRRGDWRIIERGADTTTFIDTWSLDRVDNAAKFKFAVVAREALRDYSPSVTREISEVIVDCRTRRYRQSHQSAGSSDWEGPDPPVLNRIQRGDESPRGWTAPAGSAMAQAIQIACGEAVLPTEATNSLVEWARTNYPRQRSPRRRR